MIRVIACSLCLFLLTGCGGKDSKGTAFTVPDYSSWSEPAGTTLDYPVPGHGDTLRKIFVNEIAAGVRKETDDKGRARYIFPDDSIFIKEVYQTEEDIAVGKKALTIMVKASENTASQDGWLYYMQKHGETATRIDGNMCIGCHEAANDRHIYFDRNSERAFRDYIFIPMHIPVPEDI